MYNKVYNFDIVNAFTFYKAGQFITAGGWKHKEIVNPGDYEFIIVIKGTIYVEIEGIRFSVKKHECLLIPPYTRHFGYLGADPDSTHYWMHFFPSGSVSFSQESFANTHNEADNYHMIQIPQHFKIPEFEKIVILNKQLLDGANVQSNSPLTTNFLISSIAIELANQYKKLQVPQIEKGSTKFELISEWIKIHSHEELTVSKISEHFEITPTYLTRLFKKYKHVTTNQYITQIKIQQAEELLLTTDKSVKEIAIELSFSNEKYFMRVFKNLQGITPTEFRNSYPKTYLNNTVVDPTIAKPNFMMSNL